MCGIVGAGLPSPSENLRNDLSTMSQRIAHRGPDAMGLWVDEQNRVGLAHRRLSILDLSPNGAQPMTSPSKRYVISFNGEIYNYQVLRKELEGAGFRFKSSGDTEVLLASVEHWGLQEALSRFIGLFAFALWDTHKRSLYLARDRFGKKPLYYIAGTQGWAFASELKALTANTRFDFRVSTEALSQYMRYGYIPASLCIYENVQKVEKGSVVEIDANGNAKQLFCYWDVRDAAVSGLQNPSQQSEEEIVDQLDEIISESVKLRMISDVPIGSFLSGGIDSALITALMCKQSSGPVKTFTIGFEEKSHNEAHFAKAIAAHLKTEHHELYVSESDLLKKIDRIAWVVDEPIADISIFPTLAVSELAASEIKVVLSGDGGDEMFYGYSHFHLAEKTMRYRNSIPALLREPIGRAWRGHNGGAGKVARMGGILMAKDNAAFCNAMSSQWQMPSKVVIGGTDRDNYYQMPGLELLNQDIRLFMMLRDSTNYLPNDIMHKVDRASMAVSIEARTPLLDHRVFEYAWRIPLATKYKHGTEKYLLKTLLARYVPWSLFERPKQGFGVPISAWLRSALHDWAYAILKDSPYNIHFNMDKIWSLWHQHQSGKYDRGSYLWTIILFLHWMNENNI